MPPTLANDPRVIVMLLASASASGSWGLGGFFAVLLNPLWLLFLCCCCCACATAFARWERRSQLRCLARIDRVCLQGAGNCRLHGDPGRRRCVLWAGLHDGLWRWHGRLRWIWRRPRRLFFEHAVCMRHVCLDGMKAAVAATATMLGHCERTHSSPSKSITTALSMRCR